jgi:hypothetical protein
MADFLWLDGVDQADWRPLSNGWCLQEMSWSELARRCAHASSSRDLVSSFHLWSSKHRSGQYALTWDLPVTDSSSVYVCKEGTLPRTPPKDYQATLRSVQGR